MDGLPLPLFCLLALSERMVLYLADKAKDTFAAHRKHLCVFAAFNENKTRAVEEVCYYG